MALSISCKLNEEPEVNRWHVIIPTAGKYKAIGSTTTTFTITSESACNISGRAQDANNNNIQGYYVTITK